MGRLKRGTGGGFDRFGGGTAAETNTASGPSTPTTEDDSGLDWSGIRDLFKSNEKGTSGEATQAAAMRLLTEFDLVTIEENDKIWRYNPETGPV